MLPLSMPMPDRRAHHRGAVTPRTWLGLAAVYLVAVPWYAPAEWIDPTIWAFPAWAVASVAGSLGLAVVTARALLRPWPAEESPNTGGADSPCGDEPPR